MTILEFDENALCSKCTNTASISEGFCDSGKGDCPVTLHHHMECPRCEHAWLMMVGETPLAPFEDAPKCKKCGHEKDFEVVYCEDEHKGMEHVPHLHFTCGLSTCANRWLMHSAEIDIERDFDDLDQFTENCPKCNNGEIEMKFFEDTNERKCTTQHPKMDIEGEHLHLKCNFCSFVWFSVTADFEDEDSGEGEPQEEAKPLPEVKAVEPA